MCWQVHLCSARGFSQLIKGNEYCVSFIAGLLWQLCFAILSMSLDEAWPPNRGPGRAARVAVWHAPAYSAMAHSSMPLTSSRLAVTFTLNMKILDIPRSGSVAGTTSSHNRAGQYVRNRRTPTNAPTARRTFIRAAFGAQSSGWSALTASQQLAWIAAASTHPVTDALGQSITLTGHQLYVSINTQLLNSGGVVVSSPPATFAVFNVNGTTAAFSVATGLVFTITTTGGATDHILVALSKPVPAGRSFWNTFSQFLRLAGNAATSTTTTAAYGAVFGTPVSGQKVFAKLTPVSSAGVTGVPLVLPVVVVP